MKKLIPYNAKQVEEEMLVFWRENSIFERSLEQTKQGEPFSFYDGPPFANGLPHFGHSLVTSIKDSIGRFQTMRGRYVERRNGWDCHGLPTKKTVKTFLIESVAGQTKNTRMLQSTPALPNRFGGCLRKFIKKASYIKATKACHTVHVVPRH